MNSTVTLNHRISFSPSRPADRGGRRHPARERAYRRALRAAELAAWNAADPRAITRLPAPPALPEPADRTEILSYLTLAAAVVVALAFGANGTLVWLANSETLERLLRSLLP